ncbi:MAG: 3-deoxy-D-manno-octulosonic acid transferase [Vicinamibacteria bacterium]|nr:3-deoxy-D-manno-octulosonic acid transferase [Vicinamibacteria bacterium]
MTTKRHEQFFPYKLYNLGLLLMFALALPYFLYKGCVTGKYFSSFRERLGRMPAELNPERRRSIWIHAVSVGEVLAVRPLLARLRARFLDRRLILSTTTHTGQAIARKSVAHDVDSIFYAPFDFSSSVRHVLDTVNPELLVLTETELWPNLIHMAHVKGARIAIVNGRISPRSFPRYRRIRRLLAPVLAEIDLMLMQSEINARRAVELGAPAERVRVPGNIKYDCLGDGAPSPEMRRIVGARKPLWVAGSTVEGEEKEVLAAFRLLRSSSPAARLLVAPRHPERFDEVFALVAASGFECVRRTRLSSGEWTSGDVMLLDTIGELAAVYPLADLVFVGGSLVARGGHNILEPAVAGKAVVIGPYMENFQEMADEFRADGAIVQVRSGADLARVVVDLLSDEDRRHAIGERARTIIERNRGACDRTIAAFDELLER